jgi:putative membrane protein
LRQASAGSQTTQGQLPSGLRSSFLVPAMHPQQAAQLSAEFLPGCRIDQAEFSAVDRARYMKMHLLVPWLVLAIAFGVPAALVHWGFALVPLIAAPLLAGIAHLNWKRHGYAVAGEYGFVRNGFIGTQYTLFPLFKVQRVDIRQTPLQHRRGLAHLVIHLASHSLKVPYIPQADAVAIRDLALYHAESTDRPWY